MVYSIQHGVKSRIKLKRTKSCRDPRLFDEKQAIQAKMAASGFNPPGLNNDAV